MTKTLFAAIPVTPEDVVIVEIKGVPGYLEEELKKTLETKFRDTPGFNFLPLKEPDMVA